MKPEETIKIAIHCLGVQAEQEVCEECPVYRESGIVCKEIARTAITALKEIQRYREIGTVEECREAVEKQKVFCESAGKYADGKCIGYGKSEMDDEPCEMCKRCKLYAGFEESEEE